MLAAKDKWSLHEKQERKDRKLTAEEKINSHGRRKMLAAKKKKATVKKVELVAKRKILVKEKKLVANEKSSWQKMAEILAVEKRNRSQQ